MSNYIIPILLLTDGIVFSLGAVFASDIGLDPNISWGRTRLTLLFFGMILVFGALLVIFSKNRKAFLFESIIKSETCKTLFLLGHLWSIIFVIYVWFVTLGNFTTWNHTTHYYTQLAEAFSKGNLFVDQQPGRALMEVADPYDPAGRTPFNDEVWDLSLYKGKLYLYWGPVPALLMTPIQIISHKKITDNYPVFFFSAGLLIFNSLIILKLWRNFFPGVPAGNVFICIPLIGLIMPVLWAMNIPNVYEAAIGAGQLFLMGGIYFSISIFEKRSSSSGRNLFMAGLFWACSVGSRAVNVVSVIFLAALVAFWITKKLPKPINWKKYFRAITPLFIPLIAGAIAIGWYNWARFDSPLEFGLRYQITIVNLNKEASLVFSPDYFFLNLYSYIFHPYEIISRFPFIQPAIAFDTLQKFNIALPQMYYAGRVTGLLFSAPFLVLGLVHLLPINKISGKNDLSHTDQQSYHFVILLFAGTFFLGFISILFLFFGQTRYLVDVISQITLLAIIGYWQIISGSLILKSTQSNIFRLLANALIVITICTSILLAFSSETSRMEKFNPQLFEKINNALTFQK